MQAPSRLRAQPPTPATAQPRNRNAAIRWETLVWALGAVVLLVVLLRVGLSPERNSVFGLFRRAGARWLAGQALYPKVGEFLYSPLAAAAFSPFAWLPESWSGVLWRLVNAAAYLATAAALLRRPWVSGAAPGSRARAAGTLVLLALAIGNFNNGQASPGVLALMLGAILAAEAEHWWLAAAMMAGATFFKIYPLALGLLLAALYPRQLAWRLVLALAAGFAVSLLLGGVAYGLTQYRAWFACLGADHRRVHRTFGTWRDAWLLLRLGRIPISVGEYAVVQAMAGAAAAAFCLWGQRARGWARGRTLFAALGLGCAWMTLFGPSTESATYIFLAPALAFGVTAAFDRSTTKVRMPGGSRAVLGAALALLIGGEMFNAWLPAFRHSVLGHAVQPLGALCLVGFLTRWLRHDRAWSLTEPAGTAPPLNHARVPVTTLPRATQPG